MENDAEDYKLYSQYLNAYQSHNFYDKTGEILFKRINQSNPHLGETVISEYLSKKGGNSSNSSNEEAESQEEHKKHSESSDPKAEEEKLKLSEFAALMSKREQEIYKPIYFNVLIAGESCLGKSTFIEAILDKVKGFSSQNLIKIITKEI